MAALATSAPSEKEVIFEQQIAATLDKLRPAWLACESKYKGWQNEPCAVSSEHKGKWNVQLRLDGGDTSQMRDSDGEFALSATVDWAIGFGFESLDKISLTIEGQHFRFIPKHADDGWRPCSERKLKAMSVQYARAHKDQDLGLLFFVNQDVVACFPLLLSPSCAAVKFYLLNFERQYLTPEDVIDLLQWNEDSGPSGASYNRFADMAQSMNVLRSVQSKEDLRLVLAQREQTMR